MVELRDYQKNGIRKIFEAWDPKRGNMKRVLFQMPTGTGKTTVFSEIVSKAHAKNKNVLIVVHRGELVEQIAERLLQFNVDVGFISSDRPVYEHRQVQVATIQTLIRRKFPPAEIVIIDECHHSKASSYKQLWKHYPESWFLGVTATPYRLSGEGFEDQYNTLIPLEKLSYFFEKGYLAKVKHLVCGVPNLKSVKKKLKDYDLKMLRNVMIENRLMANLTDSYLKNACGKSMIVFAVDIEHSKAIVKRYNSLGVTSAHLDSHSSKSERLKIISQFKTGEIKVLSNVDIVSEGFDVPSCEVVQLARPTKSLGLYLQQVGRCMRPMEGKQFGIVLDNAGLWLDHNLSFIDRHWTLKSNKKIKGKSTSVNENTEFVAIDEEGILKEIKVPSEAEGLELVEITPDIHQLIAFENLLFFARAAEYKPQWVIYSFCDYLIEHKIEMNNTHITYGQKRLESLNIEYKPGLWHYQKKHVNEKIKSNKA